MCEEAQKAGRRFIRYINTISVRQPRLTKQQVSGFNTDNLVFIPTDKTHDARPILTLVNHRSLKKCTIRNINTSNLKPVPKIKQHTCDGYMSLASLNCRSVVNKKVAINDYIVSNNIDLLALTETWLGKENVILSELTPEGFSVLQWPRKHRGGGLALIHKDHISCCHKPISTDFHFTHFEHECLIK